MRPTLIFATFALTALLATGCGSTGGTIQRGIDRYERLDYAGASGEFSRLAGHDGDMNNKGLVRYYVYNGLTAYHLGYRPQAYSLLARGKSLYAEGTPGWIKPTIVAEMDAALANLAGAPGTPAAPAAPRSPAMPAATGGPTIVVIPAR